ncbi:DNA internalization-related competence protein ComEC/Rec2 [Cupriavidus necator H850]|nr:DNA internalization-related competence protein ComEC/Rec2 [Cupriavidus necator H850]
MPLWLPARQAALVAAVASALAYGLLAGMQIPALRTVAMLCVAAIAVWGARAPPASVALAWAALVALLLDPWAVMLPGFWLSFGAVVVIFFAARPGRDASTQGRWQRMRSTLAAGARTQWAVTIGLVPLTLVLFGQVSVVSPLVNAVAIPLVSLVVTPLALLGAALPMALAGPVLAVAHLAMVALAAVLGWLSALPWAMWEAASAGPLALVLAALGVGLLVAPVATARVRLHGGLAVGITQLEHRRRRAHRLQPGCAGRGAAAMVGHHQHVGTQRLGRQPVDQRTLALYRAASARGAGAAGRHCQQCAQLRSPPDWRSVGALRPRGCPALPDR